MSESPATRVVPVVPTVFRWWLADMEHGEEAQAYAVRDDDRCVLIDPLPLTEPELRKLGRLEAVLLTGADRQRIAWRLRKAYGVDVYTPAGLEDLEEAPDLTYSAGEALPGGVIAFHTPGLWEWAQVLWLTTGPRGVVFVGGLLVHDGSGVPALSPGLAQPDRARSSVERILQRLPVDVLCFSNGPPIVQDGARALRATLARLDQRGAAPPG